MPYLLKREGVYYLRVKIPADLSQWFPGKTELRKSLKTKVKREASYSLAKHLERTERTFALMRSGLMTDAEIKKLADTYLRETLATNDRERLETASRVLYDDATREVVGSAVPYSEWAEEPFKVLEGQRSAEMERILASFLESKGIEVDPASVEHKKLLREIARVHLESLRIDERRDQGDFSDPYYLAEDPQDSPPQVIPQASPVFPPQPQPEPQPQGLPLSKLIELYSAEKLAQGRWTRKTEHEVTACLNVCMGILGDVDAKALTRADLVECLTKVRALKVKNKPIEERTVKKHMTHLSSLFKWGVQHEHLVRNPAEGLTPKIKKAPSEERSTYSPDDLRRLAVGLKVIKEKGSDMPERYWIPLISLYSGLRLDEICQLYKEDMKQIEGVWCIDVNREKDKKLKNNLMFFR